MNDWQLSQWISQSLAGELDESQQAQLQAALRQSPASQAFAQWSSQIQAAAAELNRIESQPPQDAATEPAERLSDLTKARLQRTVLTALKQWHQHGDSQPQLRVAQTPSSYASRPAASRPAASRPAAGAGGQSARLDRDFDELLRGGRALRDSLVADLSGMQQTLHWLAELAALANFQAIASPQPARPQPPQSPSTTISDGCHFSLEHVAGIILSMLRVQTSVCAVSLARCQAHSFDERLRVQRGPRDASELRSLPVARLRQGSANAFHQAVLDAPARTPTLDIDQSIAGWRRIMLGLPLDAGYLQLGEAGSPQPGGVGRWGLAIVEADIDRLVQAHIAAADIDAIVSLMDRHGRILFSNLPPPAWLAKAAAPPQSSSDTSRGNPSWLVRELSQTGEVLRPELGVWATRLHCPAPLDNLSLVLQAR